VAYVIERVRKSGVRYTAIYLDASDGRYKSAGTYDTPERAQVVGDQHERHIRLRLAETSPADKATITVRDFGDKFLREHAVEPNSKMTYAQLLNSHAYPFIGKRRVSEIGRETIHRLLTVVRPSPSLLRTKFARHGHNATVPAWPRDGFAGGRLMRGPGLVACRAWFARRGGCRWRAEVPGHLGRALPGRRRGTLDSVRIRSDPAG
jgi:hypothetical protein